MNLNDLFPYNVANSRAGIKSSKLNQRKLEDVIENIKALSYHIE